MNWLRRLMNRRAIRIVENMTSELSLSQLAQTRANPDHDTYQDGWETFAMVLRGQFTRGGLLKRKEGQQP